MIRIVIINLKMRNKLGLHLTEAQYQGLINKFNSRQNQSAVESALVYLKLKEFSCSTAKALLFARKKEKGTDGTAHKDGPSGCKKLTVIKPENRLTNGWLRGAKLRYAGATAYKDQLEVHDSGEKYSWVREHKKGREYEQQQRRARSQLNLAVDLKNPRRSLDRIGSIKEEASKERQAKNIFVQFEGIRMSQTTKHLFKESQNLNDEGLVIKLGTFSPLIADEHLHLKEDETVMKTKKPSISEVEGSLKRERILTYQHRLRGASTEQSSKGEQEWKRLIHRNKNDQRQIQFSKKTLHAASNPLILLNAKQLNANLMKSEETCGRTITQYSNFHENLQTAINLQYLNKRKYSNIDLRRPRRSLPN